MKEGRRHEFRHLRGVHRPRPTRPDPRLPGRIDLPRLQARLVGTRPGAASLDAAALPGPPPPPPDGAGAPIRRGRGASRPTALDDDSLPAPARRRGAGPVALGRRPAPGAGTVSLGDPPDAAGPSLGARPDDGGPAVRPRPLAASRRPRRAGPDRPLRPPRRPSCCVLGSPADPGLWGRYSLTCS